MRGVFIGRGTAPLHDAWMPVKRTRVGNSTNFRGQVHLPAVPAQALGPVPGVVCRQVKFLGPRAAGSDDQG